jgi:hypothetical protein
MKYGNAVLVRLRSAVQRSAFRLRVWSQSITQAKA